MCDPCIPPEQELTRFSDYYSETDYNFDQAPNVGLKTGKEAFSELCAAFESPTLFTEPEAIINEFKQVISTTFTKEEFELPISVWPPVFSRDTAPILLYILQLLNKCATPMAIVKWCSLNLPANGWCKDVITPLKAIALCGKGKTFTWVTITSDDILTVQTIDNDNLKLMKDRVPLGKFDIDAKSVLTCYGKDGKKIFSGKLSDAKQREILLNYTHHRIPAMLTNIKLPVPDALVVSFYHELVADDMILLRAIPYTSPNSDDDNQRKELAESILDVFAYAQRVDHLITTLAGVDFENDKLQVGEVLRVDSMLTLLAKVFWCRYGREYYDSVIKQVIKLVDEKGDIGLSRAESSNAEAAKTLLFSVMEKLIDIEHVSPQICHLLSIVKSVCGVRFNNKRAAFNAISGLFYLRFIASTVANPYSYDKDYVRVTEDEKTFQFKVMVPFCKLLQHVLNLKALGGRDYEVFKDWNDELFSTIYHKLVKFTDQLSMLPENRVEYKQPTTEEVTQRIKFIMNWMAKQPELFANKYTELMNNQNKNAPIGWTIGSFLMAFFKEH